MPDRWIRFQCRRRRRAESNVARLRWGCRHRAHRASQIHPQERTWQSTELARNLDLPKRAVALVLAGGRGSRLKNLTDRRAKPAVYFGGKFRIVDFALSNCLNSGIRRIGVITQYKSHSLLRHLQRGWAFLKSEMNEFVDLLPAQQRIDEESWYRGTADAVYQNQDIIDELPRRLHRRARRRPHLQDELRADAGRPRREGAPNARSAASRCRARRPPRSA